MAEEAQAAEVKKVKKVNRLNKEQIARKVDELEKANQVKSKYYGHLKTRLGEMQA